MHSKPCNKTAGLLGALASIAMALGSGVSSQAGTDPLIAWMLGTLSKRMLFGWCIVTAHWSVWDTTIANVING
jgi:hypothetical protein